MLLYSAIRKLTYTEPGNYRGGYERWITKRNMKDGLHTPGDVLEELQRMDEAQIEDAFYRDLAFGTGGLRGVIGAGTNRMNVYVVAKASQGLANYLGAGASVVIGYDSRIKSDLLPERRQVCLPPTASQSISGRSFCRFQP